MVRVTLEHIATTIPVTIEVESLTTLQEEMRVEGYLDTDENIGDQYFLEGVEECIG